MQRALELATFGRGSVSPNPMVGCLIVKNNQIIGEGWHQKYGEAHAEVNAINHVKNKEDLKEAELFVTLEPCSHHGKTPPCADLIVQYPFKKVYISCLDSNPLVAGKGVEKIKSNNIEVEIGILEKEAKDLNKRFFTFIEKKRPYIILKWAKTADGFIARNDYTSKWISDETSRKITHKWRSEEDAILVGTNTALYDNPSLTLRDWKGKQPLRIVIDKHLRIPESHQLINPQHPTIVYNCLKEHENDFLKYIKIEATKDPLQEILNSLYHLKIQSVIVEGGSQLLQSFIQQNLWDEARIFTSQNKFTNGIKAPVVLGEEIYHQKIHNDYLSVVINTSVLSA